MQTVSKAVVQKLSMPHPCPKAVILAIIVPPIQKGLSDAADKNCNLKTSKGRRTGWKHWNEKCNTVALGLAILQMAGR